MTLLTTTTRKTTGSIFCGFLGLYAGFAWLLAGAAGGAFENLHLVIDSSNATLSGLFALFLWSSAHVRRDAAYRAYLAVAFALVSAAELVHALVGVEWSGPLAWIMAASPALRPATWPPSTYFLPLALGLAIPAAKGKFPLAAFAIALGLLLAANYGLFLSLPSYVPTQVLGISRPFQMPALPLLAAAAWLCWRERDRDPLFVPLIACLGLLFLSDACMLWSAAPHDRWAMLAHGGKFLSYLMAHGTMVWLAMHDTRARNRAESELVAALGFFRASEARFRQLLESAPDATVVVDAAGLIALVNQRAEALFGYDREEITGHPVEILLPARKRGEHVAHRRMYHSQTHAYRNERRGDLLALGKAGHEFPVEVSISPIETEGGRLVVATVRDISERRSLERELEEHRLHLERLVATRTAELSASEARFRHLVEQSLVGICIIQGDRYRYVNPALVAMAGYASPADMLARASIRDGIAAADQQQVAEQLAQLARDEVARLNLDYVMVRQDYVLRDIEGHACRCEFEGQAAVIGILLDVTERRAAERELQRLNADLEQRVEERTARLTAVNQELQAFTYAASHDLKTPLRSISSFSDLLERRYRPRLEGDGLVFLDFIRQGATRMVALIDDLLAYSEVERNQRTAQPIDLAAAVRQAVEERQEEIARLGARVRADVPSLTVHADATGLAHVLRNLLENALKYAARAEPPIIDIGAEAAGSLCHLWVKDNGIGFDMVYQNRIFELFRRLHTYDQYPGSGIGLALVRKAMERMGGRVWAESAVGAGATFHLQLPVTVPGPGRAGAESAGPAPGTELPPHPSLEKPAEMAG